MTYVYDNGKKGIRCFGYQCDADGGRHVGNADHLYGDHADATEGCQRGAGQDK